MHSKKRRRLFGALTLGVALVGGLRGWIRGVQETLPGDRTEGLTVKIESNETGLKLDPWTGAVSTLDGAGFHWALPGLAEVYRVSTVPRTMVFGDEDGPPRLEVRSADGSGFHFEELRVDYRVPAEGASAFLRDSGPEAGAAARWVAAMTRPILCEEFGRHTAQEITDAETREEARVRAFERLAAALGPHGVTLDDLSTGVLAFDRAYEAAIQKRKVADQEVERLTETLVQKEREREKRLTAIRAEIEVRDELLQAELERLVIEAGTAAQAARAHADSWALTRRAQGEVERDGLLAQAATHEEVARKEVAAFEAELAALEGRGLVVVREQLVDALAGTRFKLTPFTQDPAPERVERVDLGAGGK